MDIAAILKQIGLSDSTLALLTNAVLLRPQLNIPKNEVTIKILIDNYLPSMAIEQLKDKLAIYLSANIVLKFEVKNKDINVAQINDYIDYYNRLNNCSLSLIPVISSSQIYLNVDDETLNKLSIFLAELSIAKHLTNANVASEDKEIIIKGKAPIEHSKYHSKFTKKDDYSLLPMDKLTISDNKVSCIGKVFSVDSRSGTSTRTGKHFEIETIIISDFKDAVTIKRFKKENDANQFEFYYGQCVQIYGIVKYDDYDKQNVFELDYQEELEEDPFAQFDDYAGEKHIELHVHTNRSEMDGVCKTDELVKQAFKYGAKAIAITDSNVVQAFPLAQQAHNDIDKKNPDNDFKVIYGIDVKVCDDTLRIVHNPTDQKIWGSEFAVIDFETTGLSTKYDHIIEFGGAIVRDNGVTEEKMQLFIKPPVKVPKFIEQKTNITNEMLEDALDFEHAIDKILDFIGDRIIVAHNADFDYKFLNDSLERIGREPIKNPCLDTLNLARQILKNKKYYRLGVIANNYKVEYDEETAHRGDYDAFVLAEVFVKMIYDIQDYKNITLNQLQEVQDKENYKKAHVYSTTLLAKNMAGIKSIYEIVTLSHTKYLTYFAKENAKKIDNDVQAQPRILKSEINKRRENILVGSCDQYSELFEMALNRSNADLKDLMRFYDYIEIEPISHYRNLIEPGSSCDEERIKNVLNDIIRIADELNIPIIASNNVYYTHKYQKIARDIYIMAKRIGGLHHPLYPRNREERLTFVAPDAHLMTTSELLEEMSFCKDRAKEFVIDNPIKISNQIEKIYPIPTKLATPEIEGSEEKLKAEIYKNARNIYGDPLPEIVASRIDKELTNVINNGFTVQYYIAYLLVKKSNEDGYPVGSRGSVGSSFIATMANITEVNPLCPHYVCPDCKHSEFFTNNEYDNGFDLPAKKCPKCGQEMIRNGHNIPFETFLGFNGDKVPDIDLNFSPEYQNTAQMQVKEIFGDDYSYRAGTIGTVAQKTAFGYVKGYCEEMEKPYFSKSYSEVLSMMCDDVKRTTGQHPGGIVVIPKDKEIHDFTPIQYPANNPFSDWLTTHYAFADLHDNILKLDILAHIDPTAIRLLSLFSGFDYRDVPFSDPKVYSLFNSTDALDIHDDNDMYHELNGAAGLPEFGTHNNRRILAKTKPSTFYELVAFEGVTHGTDVWANNAEVLIDNNICTLKEVISCRDDIMSYLISKGLDKKMSFDIMEKVRKGKGLTSQWIEEMEKHDVPQWYINSCQLIKYMFPKAHAVAYAMNAVRVAYYKLYYPRAYYAVYFSCRCDQYDIETMIAGKNAIYNRLHEIQTRMDNSQDISDKERALEPVLEIALEMYLRGYHFNKISITKSEASYFIIDPDDEKGLIPSFMSIDGLGEAVGQSIVNERNIRPFTSKADLIKRTTLNNSQISFMDKLGILDELQQEDQLSLF